MSDASAFHLYILLCDQKILYTGIAIDPIARLKQHQSGHPLGAKFTRRFKQLEIVYQTKIGDKAMAHRLEYRIKQLSKSKKLQIIKTQPETTVLLKAMGLNE
jgi:putative endonuclease